MVILWVTLPFWGPIGFITEQKDTTRNNRYSWATDKNKDLHWPDDSALGGQFVVEPTAGNEFPWRPVTHLQF